jgi:hypothetical protein
MNPILRRMLVTLALCLFPALAQPAPTVPARFERLAPARFGDGLRLVELRAREQDAPPWRIVEWQAVDVGSAPRREKVSVREGVRAMYAYPGSDYFANAKIEISMPGMYEQDRTLVIGAMEHNYRHNRARTDAYLAAHPEVAAKVAARTVPGKAVSAFERDLVNGIEVVSSTEHALGQGGAIGMIHFFVPAREAIVTVYLLNQKRNRFRDIEELLRLRANLIEGWTAFLARQAQCAAAQDGTPVDGGTGPRQPGRGC